MKKVVKLRPLPPINPDNLLNVFIIRRKTLLIRFMSLINRYILVFSRLLLFPFYPWKALEHNVPNHGPVDLSNSNIYTVYIFSKDTMVYTWYLQYTDRYNTIYSIYIFRRYTIYLHFHSIFIVFTVFSKFYGTNRWRSNFPLFSLKQGLLSDCL